MGFKINYSSYKADLRTSFLPRRCMISGKLLWFNVGYKITATYVTKNEYEINHVFWMTTTEYVMLSLMAEPG